MDNTIPSRMVGVVIETPAATLQREARAKHKIWLDNPTRENKLAYAQALRYWAKETNNKKALAYSKQLEREESN